MKIMWTAEKIKALRKRYGETQEEFCKRLGISLGGLRVWEQDQGAPLGPAQMLLSRLEKDMDEEESRKVVVPA